MKITNNYNLPVPVYQALAYNGYDKHGRYSTTGIIDSPRIHFLRKRHDAEIVVDAMDQFFMLRGSAVHHMLELADNNSAIIEQRFLHNHNGTLISMKPDMVWPEDIENNIYTMYDYKTCSTWVSRMNKPKEEWVKQLNLMRLGFHDKGMNITKLAIVAFFSDWSALEAKKNLGGNYPQQPIMIINVPLMDIEAIRSYLDTRITLFDACESLPDSQLPMCTDAERWGAPNKYAVCHYKDGKMGNAVKGGGSFETAEEAEEYRKTCTKPDVKKVQFRPGNDKRCNMYCTLRPFCSRFSKVIDKDVETEEPDPF